jgi:hypothetical protein
MPLEALLTFIGIVVAALAIMKPVQRYSLSLFVPRWLVWVPGVVSLILIVIRDAPLGYPPIWGLKISMALFLLTMGAFVVPVGAAIWGGMLWHRARLNNRNSGGAQRVFEAALKENEFDEVGRIIRKNLNGLKVLPKGAKSVLFTTKMVDAFLKANSLIHLELLAGLSFWKSLENPLGSIDVVVRALLRSELSPLRSAVVNAYGGIEHANYPDAERSVMKKTFLNPEWYESTRADYPLLMTALEQLATGKNDRDYNNPDGQYYASQGFSGRVYCPIYLAMRTQVLALKAAIQTKYEGDLYSTDLFDLFRHILQRSHYDRAIWKSDLGYWEFPTPYAYLLYSINEDLRDLCRTGLESATDASLGVLPPGEVVQQIARAWSLCIWVIADSEEQVSEAFRKAIIERYLTFLLAIAWCPSEAYSSPPYPEPEKLTEWRDLFLKELKDRFMRASAQSIAVLRDTFDALDYGKCYMLDGADWLEDELFG